jgi:hypothetical protein
MLTRPKEEKNQEAESINWAQTKPPQIITKKFPNLKIMILGQPHRPKITGSTIPGTRSPPPRFSVPARDHRSHDAPLHSPFIPHALPASPPFPRRVPNTCGGPACQGKELKNQLAGPKWCGFGVCGEQRSGTVVGISFDLTRVEFSLCFGRLGKRRTQSEHTTPHTRAFLRLSLSSRPSSELHYPPTLLHHCSRLRVSFID